MAKSKCWLRIFRKISQNEHVIRKQHGRFRINRCAYCQYWKNVNVVLSNFKDQITQVRHKLPKSDQIHYVALRVPYKIAPFSEASDMS